MDARTEIKAGRRFSFGSNWSRFVEIVDEDRIEAATESLRPMLRGIDWIGGYPFEVASPAAIQEFLADRSFDLDRSSLVGSLGCNEFLFRRSPR